MDEYVLYVRETGDWTKGGSVTDHEPWWYVIKANSAEAAVKLAKSEYPEDLEILDVYVRVPEEVWR